MGLLKKYAKDSNACTVTFSIPKEAACKAYSVHLVGEFNDWNEQRTPLKKSKDGSLSVAVELKAGREYQYRYLLDSRTWQNDYRADKYVYSPFGACDNSVVMI
jgi:1,4-alpha-glucan branching enzyme